MKMRKEPSYSRMQKVLEEMSEHIHDQDQDLEILRSELQYLRDFIEWKGLTEDFEYFKAHAHKVRLDDDLPFENYVL